MTKIKYTVEQQQVLDANGSVVVSASAGSGKTTVMIEKIINYIMSGADINRMLILTFTVSSMYDMREKLFDKINEIITTCSDEKIKQNLIKTITNLEDIEITNIDRYCMGLVKKHFFVANVDPDFSLLDEEELIKLKKRVYQKCKNTFIKDSSLNYDLFDSLNGALKNDNMFELVDKLYNDSGTMVDTEKFLSEDIYKPLNDNIDNFVIQDYIEYQKRVFIYFENILNQLLMQLSENEIIYFINNINSIKEGIQKIKIAKNTDDFFEAINVFNILTMVRVKKEFSENAIDFQKNLKSLQDKIKSQIKSNIIILNARENNSEKVKRAREMLSIFVGFFKQFSNELMLEKQKLNCLDFIDIEKLALMIMDKNEVMESEQRKYDYLFVDEYQDINPVQDKLIEKICGNNSLFLVGDLKQSIYLFRNSSPEIFVNKFNKLKQLNNGGALKLNDNFRSDVKILNFVNNIFEKLILPENMGIDYKSDGAFVGRTNYEKVNNFESVNINLCTKDIIKTDLSKECYDIAQDVKNINKQTNSKQILCVLKDLTEVLNREIFDPRTNSKRKVEFEDIAILSRKRDDLFYELIDVLKENGVPYTADFNYKLFDNIEILFIDSCYKFLSDKYDEVSLAAILTSINVGISYEDLVRIKKDKELSLYDSCVKYINENKDHVSVKLKDTLDFFVKLKNKTFTLTLYEIFLNFEQQFDILNTYMSLKNGRQRKYNIEIFKQCINDNKFGDNLQSYLEFSEEFSSKKINILGNGNSGGITVSTIHASKGLEYPIVMLIGVDKKFEKIDTSKSIISSKKYGYAICSYYPQTRSIVENMPFKALQKLILYNLKMEMIRLLYVALTRAKNHLFIYGNISSVYEGIEHYNNELFGESFLEFILGGIKSENIEKAMSFGSYKTNNNDLSFAINIYDQIKFMNEKQNKVSSLNLNYSNTFNQINEALNKTYPYQNSTKILQKTSVSVIANSNIDDFLISNPKNFYINEINGLSSIDRGNLYHKIFEKIFSSTSKKLDINKVVNEICGDNISSIEIEKIKKCQNIIGNLIEENDVVMTERQFLLKTKYCELVSNEIDDNIVVQGVVDLIIKKPNKIILIDYKTGKNKDDNYFIEEYGTQIKIYKLALIKAYLNMEVESYIYSIDNCKLICMD